MVLFIILGIIVLITVAVLGVLFYMLSKEGQKKEEDQAVPFNDLAKLKKELTADKIGDPNKLGQPLAKAPDIEDEVIPAFVPKVDLPTQPVVVPLEDDTYKKRAQELEAELQEISQKAERQLDGAKHLIETLREENETLKSQQDSLEEAQQKLNEVQLESSGLKAANADLQNQLETSTSQVRILEEQMAAVKIQMGEEISRANAVVAQLTQEKETLLASPKVEPDETLRQELETIKTEHLQLKNKYDELLKNEEEMKYEMVKSKAQSSGLERVSFNYKNQVEDLLKQLDAGKASIDQLTSAKKQLETALEEIKSQNEDLVKKDQLSQFELEKNRTRLLSLEREHEDLKARMAQKDPQV